MLNLRKEKFSKLGYFACDGKGHTSKWCPSRALLYQKRNKPRDRVMSTVL